MTKEDRYPYPTRAQWAALVHIRERQNAGKKALSAGKKVTAASLERLEWATWTASDGWTLTENGVVAAHSGDMRFAGDLHL